MKQIETCRLSAGGRANEAATAFGPVIADRIARIRIRLAAGSYAVDVVTLAGVLVGYHDVERMAVAMAVPRPTAAIVDAVTERLALAMGAMDGNAMLVLQLEFVEQLQSEEIAALFGTTRATIVAVRRAALSELSGRLGEI